MRKSYDFSDGVQGAHYKQYREGHSVRLVGDPIAKPSPAKRKNDTQLTELAGRFALISQLTKDGLEVALPMRDRGVDLIAYADLDEQRGQFVACLIQLKVTAGRRFELDRKYAGIANLLLVYVWDLEDMDETRTYALTYPEALAIVEDRRHTGTASWKRGRYSVGAPGAKLVELLQPFLMSPGGWREKVLSATGQRQRKTA